MTKVEKIEEMDPGSPITLPLDRSIVLIGLMGSGKSSIGRRLAAYLGLDFIDSDLEVEAAAGCSIEDIFKNYGEPAFRDCERKVILRLMKGPIQIIATGGGAYMDPDTRAAIQAHGRCIWLRAELDVLLKRCLRRNNRPLLHQGDPKEILASLMAERHPIYEEADIIIESDDGPHERVVTAVTDALRAWYGVNEPTP